MVKQSHQNQRMTVACGQKTTEDVIRRRAFVLAVALLHGFFLSVALVNQFQDGGDIHFFMWVS